MAKGRKTGGRIKKENAISTLMNLPISTRDMAQSIGSGSMTAGVELAVEAAGAAERFKIELSNVATPTLLSLEFAASSLFKMPHKILGSDLMWQKALDADLLRWLIQRELDTRKAGELGYSWSEMYLAMSIPKEFLR